jgi:soluble lytic murein transglycosylase-like protein
VIKRESNYNPGARHAGNYGLMQIKPQTARTMGYRGPAEGLLNADTNLMFGIKYLAGAYLVAGGNEKKALKLYSRGYYYEAKRKGLLEETGLKPAKK